MVDRVEPGADIAAVRIDFPDDESMRISHEAIYQALYIEGRGALKRELVAALRTGRPCVKPRARSKSKPEGHVTADVVISNRPRKPGSGGARALGRRLDHRYRQVSDRDRGRTLSRSILLVHLPRLDGWGEQPGTKNGPALGGYGAEAMNTALQTVMKDLPLQLRQTLTWDRGTELADHAAFTLATGTKCSSRTHTRHGNVPRMRTATDSYASISPRALDLSRWSADDLEAVAHTSTDPARSSAGRPLLKSSAKQLQSL